MFDVAGRVQTRDIKRHAAEEIVAIKRQRRNREIILSSPQTIISKDLTVAAGTMGAFHWTKNSGLNFRNLRMSNRMERYFPPGRTDFVLFPLEFISHQKLLDETHLE